MTLIFAIGCTNGIVMAADSAASDAEAGTKQPHHKIRQLGQHPILYGGSGDVGLLQKIYEDLENFVLRQNLRRIRQDIKKLVVPAQREATEFHSPYPQRPFNLPPDAVLLFAGIHDRKPWILEIERDGRDTIYGQDLGNFAAIGSGKLLAQAIFRPHLMAPRNLEEGRVLAFRVAHDAIDMAGGGLARPIRIYRISLDGNIEEVDDQEFRATSITCDLWKARERDALREALAPPEIEEREPEPPKPEG